MSSRERFQHYGVPPKKQGDYAYLLHIVRSLKSTAAKARAFSRTACCSAAMPRPSSARNLVQRGYIKGIIGLPANLFYGTGIPACIVVLDKENAQRPQRHLHDRRLQGLHQGRQQEPPARAGHPQDRGHLHAPGRNPALLAHGAGGGDQRPEERLQPQPPALHRQHRAGGLAGHRRPSARRHPGPRHRCARTLLAGHPRRARRAVQKGRPPRLQPAQGSRRDIKAAIFGHAEFTAFNESATKLFAKWKTANTPRLKGLRPRTAIPRRSSKPSPRTCSPPSRTPPLLDPYDMYQHLMDYWAETMQDDCYLIVERRLARSRQAPAHHRGQEQARRRRSPISPSAS